MQNFTILLSDQLPHFHGQVATCGDWRQGCQPWAQKIMNDIITAVSSNIIKNPSLLSIIVYDDF